VLAIICFIAVASWVTDQTLSDVREIIRDLRARRH
jgi:hypothetical protein